MDAERTEIMIVELVEMFLNLPESLSPGLSLILISLHARSDKQGRYLMLTDIRERLNDLLAALPVSGPLVALKTILLTLECQRTLLHQSWLRVPEETRARLRTSEFIGKLSADIRSSVERLANIPADAHGRFYLRDFTKVFGNPASPASD